jgi:hypothetical protein
MFIQNGLGQGDLVRDQVEKVLNALFEQGVVGTDRLILGCQPFDPRDLRPIFGIFPFDAGHLQVHPCHLLLHRAILEKEESDEPYDQKHRHGQKNRQQTAFGIEETLGLGMDETPAHQEASNSPATILASVSMGS